jgi:hypothetical protein
MCEVDSARKDNYCAVDIQKTTLLAWKERKYVDVSLIIIYSNHVFCTLST